MHRRVHARLQRADDGGGVGLRDPEPLGEGRQGTGGGITKGTQCRQQHREEDMPPLVGCALAHATETSLDHLQRVGFHIGQNNEESLVWRRERAVFVDREPAGGPGLPIEAPRRHTGVKRRRKGRDEELKRVERKTGCTRGTPWGGPARR